MMDLSTYQDYERYLDEDQTTWSELNKRHKLTLKGKVSREYLEGYQKLELNTGHIARIDDISKRLEVLTGWTLIPVTGLIPTKDFFFMLANKKYPITISIRKIWEIEFSEYPDMFHDIYGHLPLITNDKYAKFLTAYSIIALKYVNNERAVELLGRLYWYTFEMGIIIEDGDYKPYGGAIITSADEIKNIKDESVKKHCFELKKVLGTPYNPFKLQKEYFFINRPAGK